MKVRILGCSGGIEPTVAEIESVAGEFAPRMLQNNQVFEP